MQALEGVRVIELATVIAGPAAGKYLADFGADVIKVEPPAGDPIRRMGWTPPEGGDSYFWKILGRNKRCVTLDLKTPEGVSTLLALAADADVLIENFRPGTLDRLGLAAARLRERNEALVILRITGFGQDGPYASRPGFATLAEGLSGYAALSGEPDGPPLLPPIAITDEVAGLAGAFAVLLALRHAERTGQGQDIDLSLLETLLQLMGPLTSAFAHLGYEQPRMGSGLPWTVPRGTYRCADGRWVALSASADAVAERLLRLLGVGEDTRFMTFAARSANRESLEALVAEWVGQRDRDEVMAAVAEVDAAVAPVNSMADVFKDPHLAARGTLQAVDGVTMQGPIVRLNATPGEVRHAGRPQGADADELDPRKTALAED